MKNGLASLACFLMYLDSRISLPNVECRQIIPVDGAGPPSWFSGLAFPLAQIYDRVVHLVELGVVRREPRMKLGGCVVVRVDAWVIGAEVLHLIEAVLDRIGVRLVAQVPFSGEVGRVAVLLKEFRNRRGFLLQSVRIARSDHDRESRANWNASGHERSAARSATRLAIPICERRALRGDAVNVRGRVAEGLAAASYVTEVAPAGVVCHQHDDVGSLLCRSRPCLPPSRWRSMSTDRGRCS